MSLKKAVAIIVILLLAPNIGCNLQTCKMYEGAYLPEDKVALIKIEKPFPCPPDWGVYRIGGLDTDSSRTKLKHFSQFEVLPGFYLVVLNLPHAHRYVHIVEVYAKAGHVYEIRWEAYPKIDYSAPLRVRVYDQTSNEELWWSQCPYCDYKDGHGSESLHDGDDSGAGEER